MVALITSLGRLTLADAKALGLRDGSILLMMWGVGLIVVLLSPLAFPEWPSASFFSVSEIEAAKPVDFLKLYIPANVFSSLSNAVVPASVAFSILFGLALINVKNKEKVLDLLSTVGDGSMEINGFAGKIAPYGVFAITASAARNVLIVLPLLVADSKELIAPSGGIAPKRRARELIGRYPDSGGFSLPFTRSHLRTDVRALRRVVRRIDGLGHPSTHPLYRRHRQRCGGRSSSASCRCSALRR
jgi:hypothetical protein